MSTGVSAMIPIGTVRNGRATPSDEGWGTVVSEIHLRPELAPGLQGLEAFSHIVVVFLMHEAEFDPKSHLVRHPRDRTDLAPTGIFAQRARHRPNPIGITACPLLSVTGSIVRIRGLDAIDGTPVVDLKPYLPHFDRVDGARYPAYLDDTMRGYF